MNQPDPPKPPNCGAAKAAATTAKSTTKNFILIVVELVKANHKTDSLGHALAFIYAQTKLVVRFENRRPTLARIKN